MISFDSCPGASSDLMPATALARARSKRSTTRKGAGAGGGGWGGSETTATGKGLAKWPSATRLSTEAIGCMWGWGGAIGRTTTGDPATGAGDTATGAGDTATGAGDTATGAGEVATGAGIAVCRSDELGRTGAGGGGIGAGADLGLAAADINASPMSAPWPCPWFDLAVARPLALGRSRNCSLHPATSDAKAVTWWSWGLNGSRCKMASKPSWPPCDITTLRYALFILHAMPSYESPGPQMIDGRQSHEASHAMSRYSCVQVLYLVVIFCYYRLMWQQS